jgi:cobalamin biosynthesis Mg chelatase CobN
MSRNIHQNRKGKTRKPVTTAKISSQTAAASQPATAPSQAKTSPIKTAAAQEAEAARYTELPYDIKRITLFTAFVVVLLIILWIFLK